MSGPAVPLPTDAVELFIKSAKDGVSPGGCPVCQRLHMILLIKSGAGSLQLTVTPINIAKPLEKFKKIASRLPALCHGDEVLSDPDEMVQYIDDHFHSPPMSYENVQAAEACRDVFSKFSFFVKDVSSSPAALTAELNKLNNYLLTSTHKYLSRDIPDHLDCMMLPKLQHIRVAARDLKLYEIPRDLTALWRYMGAAYHDDVFTKTCPSDQEIVAHWLDKTAHGGPPPVTREVEIKRALDSSCTHSFSLPDGMNV